LQVAESVLNIPHISEPYKIIGVMVWSDKNIYQNNVADKINLTFCKFILGVNIKSSNIAVLSELGRFPIYFNIVLSMIYIDYIIAAQIY
jgi:hypothetical protein